MEILICIAIILYLKSKKSIASSNKIEDLPIKLNPKGYFEEDAFTEVYLKLKK